MQMYYSAITGGFYCDELHSDNMPADAKQISDEVYAACAGRHVAADGGGMPLVVPPEPPTFEQRAAALLAEVDKHLNTAARAKGYDSIVTAALRAALPQSPFHAEGIAFGTWMDAVYAKCYEVLALVTSGVMAEPDWPQLRAQLPTLNLPASKGA
ncbi:hypothetical protein [Variovorax paradoxus]|uniref:hypothetical protein n=1 Tax=Variovorax paradoxus TaxID=34073 RepID=UPI00248005B7|nr:hypothetical protein [Variovorax paradoxus]WGT64797.1 hypothetical protein QHG62_05500 [Variovorax paradoxus]